MKNVSIPIIVDEMNIVHQLHKINIHGVSWTSFYKTISSLTNSSIVPYFACANVERNDKDFHANRLSFFNALRNRGVNVLEGLAVKSTKNSRIEKGVDVLVALQIYKEALKGARDIIVCSADSDLVPAVKEAQDLGVRVHVIMSDYTPGCELSTIADRVISLESIVQSMLENGRVVRFKDTKKPYLFTDAESFKVVRRGLQYA